MYLIRSLVLMIYENFNIIVKTVSRSRWSTYVLYILRKIIETRLMQWIAKTKTNTFVTEWNFDEIRWHYCDVGTEQHCENANWSKPEISNNNMGTYDGIWMYTAEQSITLLVHIKIVLIILL